MNPQDSINQQPQPEVQPQPAQQFGTVPVTPPVSQPYMQQPVMPVKKSKTPIIIAAVIVLVLLIGGGIAFALMGKKDNDKTTESSISDKSNTALNDTSNKSTPQQPVTDSDSPDSKNRTKINALHAKLEEYFNENNAYPATFSTSSSAAFPGISTEVFKDDSNKLISILAVSSNKAAAEATTAPTASSAHLQYVPYSCVNNGCTGYILRAYIANPTSTTKNPYVKNSLN